MAVAFDAAATQFASIAGESSPHDIAAATFALTVGAGTNRALLVTVVFVATMTSPIVTWDQGGTNQNVPLIKSQAGVNGQLACVFGLVAPTSGQKIIRIAWTGGATEFHAHATSWTGVDQTGGATSFPNSVSATGNTATATVNVTSSAINACVSAAVAGSLQAISSVSATQDFLIHGIGALETGGSRVVGSASPTMTATYAGTDQWAIVATDILSDVGGTAITGVSTTTGLGLMTALGGDPPNGGAFMDPAWRYARSSVLWSGTSTLGTKRSAWSDSAQNPADEAARDNLSRTQ